ncbi:unnamed protein product [Cyprideis torosa]|uniref:Uncharacterized protein n=1 Tax=Cyprideis torosa TaxID=163714 RepID=A0A7R8W0N4_9CRUS|nr:unnamed protein product [Cyprideis torosa]CAG0879921.1 unnamed protein product [Cyprideis torosa]
MGRSGVVLKLLFGRKAKALAEDLTRSVGEGLAVTYNPNGCRRGAFEVTVIGTKGGETLLWSGLKRGPPRKLKFPEAESLLDDLKAALEK